MWISVDNVNPGFGRLIYQQLIHLNFNVNPQSYPYGESRSLCGFRGLFTNSHPLRLRLRISFKYFIDKATFAQKGSYTHHEINLSKIRTIKKCKYCHESRTGKNNHAHFGMYSH